MAEVKPTRVFTRTDPCTKVHLWNCFVTITGLERVTVVASRSEIGLNTPKYLRREGYAEVVTEKGVEYYVLTPEGEEWLRKGLLRHLELHPEDAEHVLYQKHLTPTAVRRRTVRKTS